MLPAPPLHLHQHRHRTHSSGTCRSSTSILPTPFPTSYASVRSLQRNRRSGLHPCHCRRPCCVIDVFLKTATSHRFGPVPSRRFPESNKRRYARPSENDCAPSKVAAGRECRVVGRYSRDTLARHNRGMLPCAGGASEEASLCVSRHPCARFDRLVMCRAVCEVACNASMLRVLQPSLKAEPAQPSLRQGTVIKAHKTVFQSGHKLVVEVHWTGCAQSADLAAQSARPAPAVRAALPHSVAIPGSAAWLRCCRGTVRWSPARHPRPLLAHAHAS